MIYIHMGIPRTCTTSIQFGIDENKDLLHSLGYLFPEAGVNHFGHHNIYYELASYDKKSGRYLAPLYIEENGGMEDLCAEIKAYKDENHSGNIILSSEAFMNLNTKLIGRLINQLKRLDDVKVLIALRRQDKYLQSYWSLEITRLKIKERFNHWAWHMVKSNAPNLNFYGNYLKIRSFLPKDKIRFLTFGSLISAKGPFKNFMNHCGLELDAMDMFREPLHANLSPNLLTLEVIRQIAKMDNLNLNEIQKEELVRGITEFAELNSWADYSPSKDQLISEDVYSFMQQKYGHHNQLLIKEFPALKKELSFTPYERDHQKIRIDMIPRASLLELSDKLPQVIDLGTFT